MSDAQAGAARRVKIIDLTTVVLGPLASQILGDLGAEVIKVEPPEGDIMRYAGPARHREMGHVFLNLNRNKRSLCLDLKRPEGAAAMSALVRQADVFMHNMRPQAIARLGFAYPRLRELNPRLSIVRRTAMASRGRSPTARPSTTSSKGRAGLSRSNRRPAARRGLCRHWSATKPSG